MEQLNQPLAELVYSEDALLELLGTNKKQLARLRLEKEFPCVYLSRYSRVYMARDVFQWLEKRAAV